MAATPASSTVTRQPAWIHYGLLLLAVSLVAATAFVSLNTTGELRNAIDWVSHTQTLRRFMSEAETALAEAHSDIRAYLLTGDQQWLDEHYARRERLKEITQTIAGMTVDNEDQSERAIFLIDLVSERIRVWDEAIVAYRESGEATARATARRMGGLGLLEAIQVQISAMEQIEVQLHDARWERLQSLLEQTRSTIIIANGLALVAGALGFWLLRRSQRSWEQQRLAEMQAARAKRQSEEKSLFLANM
ncbi:MAG: CHASE3 domain-containing protein, partial [Xanthomonadales bacterium]|nr:CHASE3 domain-containing protein [Xanthomonadales bacterium]